MRAQEWRHRGDGNPGQGGLEDGEVDERRLLKVLGKDLKGTTGAL